MHTILCMKKESYAYDVEKIRKTDETTPKKLRETEERTLKKIRETEERTLKKTTNTKPLKGI